MNYILTVIIAFFCVCCFTVPALAQYEPPTEGKHVSVYKLAAGVSYTVIQGNELSLKTKYFIDGALGLEAAAGMLTVKDMDLYQFYLAALWQPYLPDMGLLSPYIGIGPGLNFLHSYPNNPGAAGEVAYYGVIPYGLEYTFARFPIAISLDCKIPFVELNKNQLRQAKIYTTVGFGVKVLLW